MSRVRRVIQVTLLVEAEDYNIGPSARYLKSGLVTAFPGLRHANIAMQVIDEDEQEDRVLTINKLGVPSKEMLELMEFEFGPEPVEATPA
jgi:hypothetical protein